MDNFFEELLSTFKEEAEELLASWESCVLILEDNFNPETVKELFRAAHTLKGSSKTVGLEEFGIFVHQVEDLLRDITSHPSGDNSPLVGFLLDCHQFMNDWLENGECEQGRKSELLATLKHLQVGGTDSLSNRPEPVATEVPDLDKNQYKDQSALPDSELGLKSNTQKTNKGKPSEKKEIVRVNRLKISKMINFVGELGTQLTVLEHQFLAGTHQSRESHEALEYCLKYIKLLQEYTISLSMQPIDRFLQRLERSCKDVARTTKKRIEVEKIGMSIELDKTVLDQIADPFIHIVRNAADHGIEDTETRISSGKDPTGHITLQAVQKADLVEFTVQDDGAGLDRDRIFEKAVEKGLISRGEALTDEFIYQLIMRPGFSTKTQVTEISGRGVGLDVVSESLNKLGGSLKIESKKGRGTKFIVSIPTNFSMVEAVLVAISGTRYAIPLKDFAEIIDLSDFNLQLSDVGSCFFKMREEIVSLHSITDFLDMNNHDSKEDSQTPARIGNRAAIINRNSHQPLAFEIDKLYGRLNLFVKPLTGKFANMPGVSGTAILPDGQAGLVLNLSEIAKKQQQTQQRDATHG